MTRTQAILKFVVLCCAWSITLATPAAGRFLGYRIATSADLPYLLNPNPSAVTDVRSSAFALLLVIAVAALAAAFAELAKVKATAGVVAAVFVFQLLLIVDCVRAYARDWWTYFVIVLNGRRVTWFEDTPVSAVMWPWISGIACLVVGALLVVSSSRVVEVVQPNSS
jgi:hypothetical protein